VVDPWNCFGTAQVFLFVDESTTLAQLAGPSALAQSDQAADGAAEM
jgi:hypothetical protein